jgi:predicted permease
LGTLLEAREVNPMNLAETVAHDLRHGVRMLVRNVMATVVMVFALALGIGVSTAVLTCYKAMVARPLNARAPAEMVNIALTHDSGDTDYLFSYPDYTEYRDSLHCFSGLIAYRPARDTLSKAGDTNSQRTSTADSTFGRLALLHPWAGNSEFASVFVVSENYFKVLGVKAIQGRTFDAMSVPELVATPSVLISENYWQTRFSGDPAILGKTIYLNGLAVAIAGITPHDFVGTGVAVPAFWMPISIEPLIYGDDQWLRTRESQRYRLFGRLASGISIAQAQAQMGPIVDHVRTLHDSLSDLAKPAKALVWPGSPFPLPLNQYRGLTLAIYLILGAAAMVLAVACANVSSLQLARVRSREDELRTRISLGSTRLRIVRQLLTESALVGLLSGAFALLLSWAFLKLGVRLLGSALPVELGSLVFDVNPDLKLFALACVVSLSAGMLSGLAPALESSRSALSSAVRGHTSARSRLLQDALVALQVCLSLTLLIAGSMAIRSSINLLTMDAGYESKHSFSLKYQFPENSSYTPARKLALAQELRTRLAALPDVTAITSAQPPGANPFQTIASPVADKASKARQQLMVHYGYVQGNYFQTLSIPLTLGRSFQAQEDEAGHSVIVSESVARQLWPAQNPVGRSVLLGRTDERFHSKNELLASAETYEVVGVARDIRGEGFDANDPKRIYLPLRTDRIQIYPFTIRTRSNPEYAMKAVEPVISSVDSSIMATYSTLDELLRQSSPFIVSSLAAMVASAVGILGLLLAVMGIYGMISYIVTLRTRELGIRMAIGAQKHDVVMLILGESSRAVLAGLMAGVLLALSASYLARRLLFGISATDGISLIGVSFLFLLVALLASYPPVRRAMRVDPAVALRYE